MREEIIVSVIRSRRKTLAIQIRGANRVEVRAPLAMPAAQIEAFVRQQEEWIKKHLQMAAERQARQESMPPFTEAELRELARQAGKRIAPRAAHFARLLSVTYGRITIRSQKTRWGSCSGKGNLNFNCLLALVPDDVLDYVVVHELCHRKEMNHSPRFWAEVGRILPDYPAQKDWLKKEGPALIARLP